MRRRRWRSSRSYLAGSLALSVAAGLLLRGYVGRVAAVASAAVPQAAVVVASAPIERGSALVPGELHLARMPLAFAPPRALDDISKASGRVALADLSPGEVVTETRLARVRAGPVASLIPRGLRAFAVPTSLPSGAVVAGDRVDVLATYASGQPHSEVVVEAVEVLFVLGPSTEGRSQGSLGLDAEAAGAGAAATLILLVSPDQEEGLAFARAFANLEVAIEPAG
jgi:pilus assembly protein CpaB